MTKIMLSLRIDPDLMDRLRLATVESKAPYAPSLTQVVERGIELALRELERKK